jgi:hypothetical protein
MDKIPAALQHKIDYINALDISDKSKFSRITIATINYQSYCRARSDSDKNMPYFKGAALESLATFLDKHDEECAKKWEEEQKKIEAVRMLKGNNLGYNADSLGLVLGSKPARINEDKALPPELSVSSVPVPPKRAINEGNKPDQLAYKLSCCLWAGAFVLCGGIGLVLGVTFGGLL